MRRQKTLLHVSQSSEGAASGALTGGSLAGARCLGLAPLIAAIALAVPAPPCALAYLVGADAPDGR